VLHIE